VTQHRFIVGQPVTYAQTRFPNLISGEECVIVRLLPTRYQGPEYLVACASLGSELVVGEQELVADLPASPVTIPNMPREALAA
jgi:hypothetical protein